MNARTFGTDDRQAEFFARYGTGSYEETGHAIAEAQNVHATDRSDWVAEQNRRYARRQVGTEAQQGVSPDRLAGIEGVAREPRGLFTDRASDKAISYLVSLWLERSNKATAEQVRTWAESVDRTVVSDKIDWLKTQPKLAATEAPKSGSLERHNVPAGRYAVTGNDGQTVFVKVDRPTEGQWAGRIFVKIQAGDEMIRTSRPAADALLGKIAAAGVQEAMLRYGREIGSCGHCGRTLTNEESREAGIGPVCRGKMGW
jgi:hypothetical protein